MASDSNLILGEIRRTIDERYRLSVPPELFGALGGERASLLLMKERWGCLSLWNRDRVERSYAANLKVIRGKLSAGVLDSRLGKVQRLGRLLSTRQIEIKLSGRGRLLLPEGFREFLNVEANSEVVLVGAAVCVEIWNAEAWMNYLQRSMPSFRRIFDQLIQ